LKGRALFGRAFLAVYENDARTASVAREALELFRAADYEWGVAGSLIICGWAADAAADQELGKAHIAEGLRLAREVGDPWLVSWAILHLCNVGPVRDRQYDVSIPLLEESLGLARRSGGAWLTSWALDWLGQVMLEQGRPDRAESLLQESLALRRRIRDRLGVAWSLLRLGDLYMATGDFDKARAANEERLETERLLGNRHGVAHALWWLGWLDCREGDLACAEDRLLESLEICRLLGHEMGEELALYCLGVVALARGDTTVSKALTEQALELCPRFIGGRLREAEGLITLGKVALLEGDARKARELLGWSVGIFQDIDRPDDVARWLEEMVTICAESGSSEQAARLAGSAAALRESCGFTMQPILARRLSTVIEAVRTRIGRAAFADAWAAGQTMSAEEAVPHALIDLDGVATVS
jgi:tetratricopeptide (TPR) repeat protein